MLQSTRSQRIGHDWATEQQQHTVNITYMHRETKKKLHATFYFNIYFIAVV